MQGDDPEWRMYFQNLNYFVGLLDQTMQRDANDAVIYGPAPVAIYPARSAEIAPARSRTAPSLYRSLPSSGRTPRRTVCTWRTSAKPSTARQQFEDHPSGRTNIPTRCIQKSAPAVLQPKSQREDHQGSLQ
jgi:hypothetical protein